jgi:hypothetical protein
LEVISLSGICACDSCGFFVRAVFEEEGLGCATGSISFYRRRGSRPATLLTAPRPTMGYQSRRGPICSKICSMLITLADGTSNYDHIAPKIEYWIEYVLREGFASVDELVEGISGVAWGSVQGSYASIGRFFREFSDAPHRSEQAKSFVSQFSLYVLRWFAIASIEDLGNLLLQGGWCHLTGSISPGATSGFINAASFIGYLIKWGLLSHELIQRHLIKPLTNHLDNHVYETSPGAIRAKAIYQLLTAAGDTLLQGLLKPDDVQDCFNMLDARPHEKMEFDSEKVKVRCTTRGYSSRLSLTCEQEFREIHAAWIQRRKEQNDSKETREEDMAAGETSAEVKTPVAFAPQNLPVATIPIEIPSSILQDIESSSLFSSGDSSLETFIDVPSGAASPTLSISTVSDLAPMEFGEESERGETQTATRHDTLYFEDGNVEIVCGDTVFRIHSSIVSFSSSELRDILSQQALLDAPTPEGRPRITTSDSTEDFATLLKMIYTPGLVPRPPLPHSNHVDRPPGR